MYSSAVRQASTNLVMVAVRADRAVGSRSSASSAARGADDDLLDGTRPPPVIEGVALCQLRQLGGECPGTVELAGFDAQPALDEARVGVVAVRPLREAECFDPACRVRQLGLGVGEIAARQAGQRQMEVRRRNRVVRLEPHRLDLVVI